MPLSAQHKVPLYGEDDQYKERIEGRDLGFDL